MERLPEPHHSSDVDLATDASRHDAIVVERAQRDPAAFAPLYEAYVGPIFRYCYRRLGSHEAAEDATSLIFERALRSLSTFRGGSFRAWLFAIAHNAVTDAYRRRIESQPFEESLSVPDPGPPPEQVAVLADERRLLGTALALLPADQRQVIELRLSGLPAVDVAVILKRSPEAVRALQLRATRRLQLLLAAGNTHPEARHA